MSCPIIGLSAHLKKQKTKTGTKKQLPIIFLAVSLPVVGLDRLQKQQIKMLDVLSKSPALSANIVGPAASFKTSMDLGETRGASRKNSRAEQLRV